MASIQTYDWIITWQAPIFFFVQCSKCASYSKQEGRCAMKMTDQMERDYFQAALANGRANRNESSDADDLKAASVVMGLLVFAAMLMIWLGR